jgi:serine/threonine protein kinase/tetratricopeptide (TPR) repeat protein
MSESKRSHESEASRKGALLQAGAGEPSETALVGVTHGAKATISLEIAESPDEAVGQMLGRYKLLEKIGEGGCGVVYVAEQTESVRRRVALKVIKLGMDTKAVVARFEAERQALAMMDHPNIAKVLDAGATDTGRPFFVMELVRGIRITEYCDQANLSTRERLDLFIRVCQAIQHAHQKGIIHRDIKPSNILVTLHDGVPVPKVIDFGIAKATEGRLTEATVYTQLHQFIGTPAYMSPEQAEMSGLDIDTRSDIYSLGVLLYELLAGSTPFDPKELAASGIDAMRKTIREKEPVRPSTRFATLKGEELTTTAKRRSADTSKLLHQLKGDLDWIVMKCLEKDRTRRYDTANDLAMDLKRHLNNEPVVARPPSSAYRLQKAFNRNKLVFAAGTAIAAALVLGVVGTSIGLVRAEHQRRAAEAALRLAEHRFQRASRFVEDVFQKVAPEFSELIGAAKARETLAQTSVSFLESLSSTGGSNESFQVELATLYGQFANALGDPFAPNSTGDYDNALRFANQSLAILQSLQSQHPNDKDLVRKLARAQNAVGSILHASDRLDEALVHYRRSLELFRQLLDQPPRNAEAKTWVQVANFKIGHILLEQGQAREALEQHYLPYGKEWLDRALDPTLASREAHMCYVAHQIVGRAEMQLDQPARALLHFDQALRWKKLLIEREPNEARYARDWSTVHCEIGPALIALGRYDEGMTNLQEAVHIAESIVARDPMNGSSQQALIEALRRHAEGAAKVAGAPETAPSRQSELWRQAVLSLTQSQERLASPELERISPRLSKTAREIAQELNEAHNAMAKIAGTAEAKPTRP